MEDEKKPKPSLAKVLKYGADPNSLSFEPAGERRTLLCLACQEALKLKDEEFPRVKLLMDSQADPNRRSETGDYPLQLAIKADSVPLARLLLQNRADVNNADEKLVTPLHIAVHNNHARTVQLLLMYKAKVNAVDRIGQPAIFFGCGREVMNSLLKAEADLLHLNSRGQSALHMAAHNGQYEAAVFLTEHELMMHMIDMQDERGRTPLHHAAARGHQAVVSRLMDIGADARMKTNNGQTAMTLADQTDVDVAYYIYTRVTGGNKSTWREVAQNPIALTLAAVIGVACFVNRKLLWEFTWDLVAIYQGR